MSRQELEHAKRYAVEATKVFLLDHYQKHYPHYFRGATVTTRPATRRDYYVPPSLAHRCIVVERTAFAEIGCRRLACFPYKRDLAFCAPHDPPHWIQIGTGFSVACQPSCREQTHSLDTEWRNGQCRQVNASKKVLALFPERLFERSARQAFHGGLDVVDNELRLNETYCRAYGLDFNGHDCLADTAQKVGEFFIGTTAYRAMKTARDPRWEKNPPSRLPDYLNYAPPPRTRRSPDPDDDGPEDPSVGRVFREIAAGLAADTAVDVSVDTVAMILKKKVPRLLTRSLGGLPVKTALQEAVKNYAIREFSKASLALGKAVHAVSTVYAVYGVVMAILDIVDPFEYNKVLSRYALDEINRDLDAHHFGELGPFPEVTPEDVWESGLLGEEDESERYAFLSERVQEYLDALHALPEDARKEGPVWSRYVPDLPKRTDAWKHWLHGGILLMMVGAMVLSVRWMHVWTACLFFLLVACRKI